MRYDHYMTHVGWAGVRTAVYFIGPLGSPDRRSPEQGESMPRRAPHNQRPRKRTRSSTATTVRRHVAPVEIEERDLVGAEPTEVRSSPPSDRARTVRPYGSRAKTTQARALPRAAIHLSKAQEYAFVREDLKRLLLTSGALVLVMILLLFVIER